MKKSKEVIEASAAVAKAAAALRSNHYAGIINAALEHFRANIDRSEKDILQHTFFKDEVYLGSGSEHRGERSTRQGRIDSARQFIAQYQDIVRFLIALKELVMLLNAEQFAAEMVAYFCRRGGIKKAGT